MGKAGGGKGAKAARKRISSARVRGSIVEWRKTQGWGWIQPEADVDHPDISKNNGRIYLHKNDIKGFSTIKDNMVVDFCIYADHRGLGAEDVREVAGANSKKLPPGWEKKWSDEHECHYYWNSGTKESSWTHPGGEDDNDEDEEVLPPGWSKVFDKENDTFYYWHKPSRTASWEPPKAPAAPKQMAATKPEPPAKTPEPAKKVKELPVLGQTRVQGVVTQWYSCFGWIVPLQDLGPDLEPSLQKSSNKIYVNQRDVKGGDKLKVGQHVNFLLSIDDSGLAANEVKLHVDGDEDIDREEEQGDEKLRREWAQQDSKAAERQAAERSESHGLAEVNTSEGGSLLPGWTEVWSEEHQCHYFWHAATKNAIWERPSTGEEEDEDGADTDPNVGKGTKKLWEGQDSQEGAAVLATPMTPLVRAKLGQIRSMTPSTPTASTRQGPVARLLSSAGGAVRAAKPTVFIPVKRQRVGG